MAFRFYVSTLFFSDSLQLVFSLDEIQRLCEHFSLTCFSSYFRSTEFSVFAGTPLDPASLLLRFVRGLLGSGQRVIVAFPHRPLLLPVQNFAAFAILSGMLTVLGAALVYQPLPVDNIKAYHDCTKLHPAKYCQLTYLPSMTKK